MIPYLIKASLVLSILWLFYKVFLERESFFWQNRIFLFGSLLLTFVLPFVSLPSLIADQGIVSQKIESQIYSPPTSTTPSAISRQVNEEAFDIPKSTKEVNIPPPMLQQESEKATEIISSTKKPRETKMDLWYTLSILYCFGLTVFIINLVVQIVSILIRVAKSEEKIVDGPFTIIHSSQVIDPCSFFNFIFIQPQAYDYDTYQQIIEHEKIHASQLHTIDLLLAEIALALLWFNPLSWLFRREVVKVVEYQTDDLLLRRKVVEKKQYQMNLLKIATHAKPLVITTNYNQSLIKQRILRMSSKKSNLSGYLKYAFTVPLLLGILLVLNKPSLMAATDKNMEQEAQELGIAEVKAPIKAPPFNHSGVSIDVESDCDRLLEAAMNNQVEEVRTILSSFDIECLNIKNRREKMEYLLIPIQVRTGADVFIDLVDREIVIDYNSYESRFIPFELLTKSNKALRNLTEYATEGCSLLLEAIKREDVVKVKELLTTIGPNCVHKNAGQEETLIDEQVVFRLNSRSPLVAAARVENIEITQLLLDAGAKVNLHDTENETPLIAAAAAGNLALIKVLLDHGAEINREIKNHGTALIKATQKNHLEAVRLLVAQGAKVNQSLINVGPPLMYAARNTNIPLMKFLLEAGADVDFATPHIGSPLIFAVRYNQITSAEFLIRHGADPNKEVIDVGTPLSLAAYHGRIDFIHLLLAQGADINQGATYKGTALMQAAMKNRLDVVKLLLDKGANPNQEVSNCGTPLMYAASRRNIDMIKVLLEKGAFIDQSIATKGTPMIWAARHGHLDVMSLLLDNGAYIDKEVANIGTPLTEAIENRQLEAVRFLTGEGADISKSCSNVGTALIVAIKTEQIEMAKILLESSDLLSYDRPIDLFGSIKVAEGSKNEEMVELLRSFSKIQAKKFLEDSHK